MTHLYTKHSPINGFGLFSHKAFKKNQIIAYIHGPIHVFRDFTPAISKKMLNWIGVGRFSWIDTTNSPFRHINHSCDPNTALVTARKVIAIKKIPSNTELTMDYSLNEAEPDWVIEDCGCGAANCRGTIGPIQTLDQDIFLKKLNYIPKKFQKVYQVEQKLR